MKNSVAPHAAARRRKALRPVQIICFSFLIVIAAGTFLLMLPFSTRDGLSLIDAMFTATSATCVTGLVVADTYTAFTPFGQAIILLLIQIGGLGLVTLTAFFALAMRRRVGLRDLRLIGESVSADSYSQAVSVLHNVVLLAFFFEGVGTVLLLFAFVPQYGPEGIWISVFLSVSAFCNAGFDILGRVVPYASLTAYVANAYVQVVIMALIVAGGLGFMVWVELAEWRKTHHLSFHSRIVLIFSGLLWAAGTLLFAVLEWSNSRTLGGLPVWQKLLASLFQSVSARTAGMNTVDLAACSPLTKLMMSVLMFIGAAPGGTGGGVKVTTFAVLVMTIRSVALGRDECTFLGHRVPFQVVYRSLSIITLGAMAAFIAALATPYAALGHVAGADAVFEAFSAFATVGLSVGVTGMLALPAKLLYMVVMFIGRVGPVSLMISLAEKADPDRGKILPEGHINVG